MEVGKLADAITARADVTRSSRRGLSTSALPERPTLTSVIARRGQTVAAGDPLITVNGRPLFVLPGSFDFYRDLAPGIEGLDVTQLQTGLARAGHPVSEAEAGTFGAATEQAVRDLYAAAGFEPVLRARPQPPQPSGPRATPPPPLPPMVVMPVTEVVVAPRLPAVLTELPAVGASLAPNEPFATLETGDLVARALVAPQAAVRLEPGMHVELVADDGRTAVGKVAAVSARGDAADAAGSTVLVAPRRPLPRDWAGQNVLARITISVHSKETLIVPTVAVTGGPEGEGFVSKQVAGGGFVRVDVRELGTLAGRSAIEPVQTGALVEGDQVRVG